MKLSIVVPCYNEEENVEEFYRVLKKTMKQYLHSTEVIFVDDGSKDDTYKRLENLEEIAECNIRRIRFSRNFGKEAALLAGLEHATGEYVAIIDADLQQHPKYVVDMLEILEGHPEYDCVAAYQAERKESKVLKFFKDCFYNLINKITEVEFKKSASDFRVLRRNMVEAILQLPERCRFSKGIFSWVGFNTYYMSYEVEERAHGESKWSFWKLFAYAVDGIVAFSTTPLIIASVIGVLFFGVSIAMLIFVVLKTIIFGEPVAGYPTIVSLILLTSGVQLFCIGVLGQYLSKNYTESKRRPMFIIKENKQIEVK